MSENKRTGKLGLPEYSCREAAFIKYPWKQESQLKYTSTMVDLYYSFFTIEKCKLFVLICFVALLLVWSALKCTVCVLTGVTSAAVKIQDVWITFRNSWVCDSSCLSLSHRWASRHLSVTAEQFWLLQNHLQTQSQYLPHFSFLVLC